MIAGVIHWSARNGFLVLLATDRIPPGYRAYGAAPRGIEPVAEWMFYWLPRSRVLPGHCVLPACLSVLG
jgi:hypothetical protein